MYILSHNYDIVKYIIVLIIGVIFYVFSTIKRLARRYGYVPKTDKRNAGYSSNRLFPL